MCVTSRHDTLKKKKSMGAAPLLSPYLLEELKELQGLGRGRNFKIERARVSESVGKPHQNITSLLLPEQKVSVYQVSS